MGGSGRARGAEDSQTLRVAEAGGVEAWVLIMRVKEPLSPPHLLLVRSPGQTRPRGPAIQSRWESGVKRVMSEHGE